MSFKDNRFFKSLMGTDEENEEYDSFEDSEDSYEEEGNFEEAKSARQDSAEEEAPVRRKSFRNTGNVVQMHTSANSAEEDGAKICMIMPQGYENSSAIANYLLEGKSVVLNMEGMNIDSAQRIIDFTSGACYTMGGNLQKISKKIFIATPPKVELTGDFLKLLGETDEKSSMDFTL